MTSFLQLYHFLTVLLGNVRALIVHVHILYAVYAMGASDGSYQGHISPTLSSISSGHRFSPEFSQLIVLRRRAGEPQLFHHAPWN
jgi:hypothetical protein